MNLSVKPKEFIGKIFKEPCISRNLTFQSDIRRVGFFVYVYFYYITERTNSCLKITTTTIHARIWEFGSRRNARSVIKAVKKSVRWLKDRITSISVQAVWNCVSRFYPMNANAVRRSPGRDSLTSSSRGKSSPSWTSTSSVRNTRKMPVGCGVQPL